MDTDSTNGAANDFEQFRAVRDELKKVFNPLRSLVLDEPTVPLGLGDDTVYDLDLSDLVNMRRDHQTEQAAQCARTKDMRAEGEQGLEDDSPDSPVALRKKIARAYHDILRANKVAAPRTGGERSARWTGSERDGGGEGSESMSGNASNAAAVASMAATKVCTTSGLYSPDIF